MEFICVSCPVGCLLEVTYENETLIVKGNECAAGIRYVKEEITKPTRNITTSVKIVGGSFKMLSVKTEKPAPKELIMDIVNEIHKVKIFAPVKVGDIIIENILDTGINILATRNVESI